MSGKEFKMTLPPQWYRKAVALNFFSGQTMDPSSASERATCSTSSSSLFFYTLAELLLYCVSVTI